MDTSETYIKMCDCPEIQEQMGSDGDYYYWSVDDKVHISHTENFEDYTVTHPEQWDYLSGRRVIWLSRQDQLQEMIEEPSINLLNRFYQWCNGSYPVYPYSPVAHFTSLEQLWLAFYMKEKFNKTWDGEWIER